MPLSNVINSLATRDSGPGYYVVTRRLAKVPGSDGIFVAPPGGTSTLKITAVREPATGMQRVVGGRDLVAGEQGQTVTDIQVLYCAVPLYTRDSRSPTYSPLHDPDLIAMKGGTYEVFRTEDWELHGETTYRVVCTRLNLGSS